ncbi:AraC family transcriptional regulator [Dokdonella sp.]|uniref:AraC family transcriptional regulator n=1 Tax=Dokdonella sp. TaxID=2291710 RepID=UPI002F42F495
MDRLDTLLQRFSVSARMFHAGALCGITEFAAEPGLGQLHLVRRGPIGVSHAGAPEVRLQAPSLLLYPRPLAHRFDTDPAVGADMACAHLSFAAGGTNPLADALPAFICLPLADLDGCAGVLEVLFDEAFQPRCGRQVLVDRLFEAVFVFVLRRLMDDGRIEHGLFAGLAHPQLARALTAMHERPAQAWTLESLAAEARMSRSAFAAAFRDTVGTTAADYLARWRVGLAQHALRRGRPLKLVADEVGYGSEAALSRAFKTWVGRSPREWRRTLEAEASGAVAGTR